ncbi:MAG: RAD55 family ATPase, partial [Pyrobaculum sp.]
MWYRINSLGHIIRYIQLEKSRTRPPSPRYMFEIIEGAGIMYIYPLPTRGKGEVVEDEKLGITAPRRSTICIHSEKVKNVVDLLSKIKDKSIFLQVGYWTSFHGLEIREDQIHVVRIFHDIYKLIYNLASNGPKASYLVVGGLLNLPEEDRKEYHLILSIALNYVDF